MTTRSKSALYLLGEPTTAVSSIRLASNGEALGLFCHHHLNLGLTTRQASSYVIEEVTKVWNIARIPTCRKDHAIAKLELLYKEWSTLKKRKTRQSESHTSNETQFCGKMNDLLDIAHANAVTMIKIQEDLEFLAAQREPGRRGYMGSIDTALVAKEERKAKRTELENARRKRAKDQWAQASASAVLDEKDYISEEERIDDDGEFSAHKFCTPPKKKIRATKKVITPQLAAALDRTKMSDRKATFVIAETAQSLGYDISDLSINRSTIKRGRERYRSEIAAALKNNLSSDVPLTVHWDGKLMQDLCGKDHVDRLPIIVTGFGVCQLLKVSKMVGGTGKNQASAVVQALQEWRVQDRVIGMCFDTTSSNTGIHIGACVEIERALGKDLLYLACRHHIMELLAGAAFTASLTPSSAPEVLLFKRFQQKWSVLDQTKYETGSELGEIPYAVKQETLEFAHSQLLRESVRDDYRELLQLSIIFLGGSPDPARGINFMAPGAMHHARWMSKVIYSLKVWMFRSQFKLTAFEEKGLRKMCVFTVIIYLKAWFTAPLAASAPRNDLQLLQNFYSYRQFDEKNCHSYLQEA